MSESGLTTLCQYCLDRGLEPSEAIGLYMKLPICDACLSPLMNNKSDAPTNDKKGESLDERRAKALEILDEFEALASRWPLTADETLLTHADFYNHRPPAIVNCSLDEILAIYSRRKGLLYSIRHKDERWYTEIEQLKRTAREEANLTGILKSKAEKVKAPTAINLAQKEKLAKSMGITVEELNAMGQKSREREFAKVVGNPVVPVRVPEGQHGGATKAILSDLQEKVKSGTASTIGKKKNPFTGKWE